MGNICEECGRMAEIGDICHECTVSGIETPLRNRIAEFQRECDALKAENERLQQENADLVKHNASLLSSFKKEQDLRFAAEDALERVKKAVSR